MNDLTNNISINKKLFEEFFLNHKEAAIIINADNDKVLSVNEIFLKLTGYRQEDVLGKDIYDLNLIKDKKQAQVIMQHLIKKGQLNQVHHSYKDAQQNEKIALISLQLVNIDETNYLLAIAEDITEQQKIEKNALVFKKHYDIVYNSPLNGIVVTDNKGKILSTNGAFERFLGYSKQELGGKDILDLTYHEDRDSERIFFADILNTNREEYRIIKRYINKNGQVMWADVLVTIFGNQEGSIESLMGIVVDITETKNSKETLQHFFELSIDYLCIIDTEGYFVEFNPALLQGTGYTEGELKTTPYIEFIHPKDKRATLNFVKIFSTQSILPSEKKPFVNRLRCRDGSYKWIEWTAAIDRDGLIYAVARDITERKKIEIELLKFASIIESSNDAIIGINLGGIIMNWNKSAEKIYGYTKEEIIGKPLLTLIPRETHEKTLTLMETISAGGAISNFESKRIRKDGLLIDVSIQVSPIKNLKGKIVGSSVIYRDISERKKIEKEMNRLGRLNLIGQLSATISHEVRNPLTTVRGFLQLLGEKEGCLQYKEYFTLMIEELDRANSIITEFLAVGKNKVTNKTRANLNDIIRTLFPLVEAYGVANDKRTELELGFIPDLILDEKEIRQVILNISHNGFDAMTEGGTLKIQTYQHENHVVLAIKDEGKGIEPAIIDQLGTPFLTTKDKGTGLGLPACYRIMENHNGKIDVETGLQGTTFILSFNQNYA